MHAAINRFALHKFRGTLVFTTRVTEDAQIFHKGGCTIIPFPADLCGAPPQVHSDGRVVYTSNMQEMHITKETHSKKETI